MRTVSTFLLLVAISLVLASCGGSGESSDPVNVPEDTVESDGDFTVLEWDWVRSNPEVGDGSALIQNNTDNEYSLVQVSAVCHDSEDVRVGEGIGVSSNLQAQEKVKIGVVLILEDDPEDCVVSSVTGY